MKKRFSAEGLAKRSDVRTILEPTIVRANRRTISYQYRVPDLPPATWIRRDLPVCFLFPEEPVRDPSFTADEVVFEISAAKCECGGHKANTPHSHWCPSHMSQKEEP